MSYVFYTGGIRAASLFPPVTRACDLLPNGSQCTAKQRRHLSRSYSSSSQILWELLDKDALVRMFLRDALCRAVAKPRHERVTFDARRVRRVGTPFELSPERIQSLREIVGKMPRLRESEFIYKYILYIYIYNMERYKTRKYTQRRWRGRAECATISCKKCCEAAAVTLLHCMFALQGRCTAKSQELFIFVVESAKFCRFADSTPMPTISEFSASKYTV